MCYFAQISMHSKAKFNAVARRLNARPSKTVIFDTPRRTIPSIRCIERLIPQPTVDLGGPHGTDIQTSVAAWLQPVILPRSPVNPRHLGGRASLCRLEVIRGIAG